MDSYVCGVVVNTSRATSSRSEVTVPGRLPGTRQLLGRVLREASLLVSAGGYPEAEARRTSGRDPVRRFIPGAGARTRPAEVGGAGA